MDLGGVTWIVVADAERARVFVERRRGGDLVELEAEGLRATDGDHSHGHRHRVSVHESGAHGRHGAGQRQLGQEAARRFLHRVAQRLECRLDERAFDWLVVMAPPRALGLLRSELDGKVSARLAAADTHDCVGETAEDIRGRLRHARAATPSG